MRISHLTFLIKRLLPIKPVLPIKSAVMAVSILSLISCGGGSSGGSNSAGSGGSQQPDPVVVDLPIAYIERPIPVDEDDNPVFPDLLDPIAFNPGAKILLKDRATALAATINITDAAFAADALYDVKDLSVHPAGDRLLFAMHAPMLENVDEDDQPTWNIWEYHLKTKLLRRVISSDIVAEAGQDLSPRYLPDGSILFSSTRQTRSKAVLLDDGKPQYSALEEGGDMPAFVLHTMKDDGSDIQQITYNQSHDLQPTVLQNGRVLYTRWDQFGRNNLSFYTVNPDGTQAERAYGFFSLNSAPAMDNTPRNRLFRPQEMQDGRIAAILKPDAALLGGDMVMVDTQHFFENELQIPAGGGKTSTAQNTISILPVNIAVGSADAPQFSVHGRFAALTPLYDGSNRLLVSWSQCRLVNPANQALVACTPAWLATTGISEAPPLYGIWVYNITEQSQQPVVLAQEGKMFTEPVSFEVRTPPTYQPPSVDVALSAESVGLLHIRSVYDMDGSFTNFGMTGAPNNLTAMAQAPADQRPARFVRFIKAVSIPDEATQDALGDNTYGALFNNFADRKEILGYAPVEPDGSVNVKVPADVAFTLEILDKDGKRIGSTKNNWLQLRPGEVRECNGCHDNRNTSAGHGRADAEMASINAGATTSGAQFPNTLRFDKFAIPEGAIMGETMAEFASRTTYCLTPGNAGTCAPFSSSSGSNLRAPSVALVFNDEWSPAGAKSESFAYLYQDLTPLLAERRAPTSEACMESDGWSSLCRITINYEQHIQGLWERSRMADGIERQCSLCHSTVDEAGNQKVPDGQLDFARTKNAANQPMLSYTQLLNSRDKRILNDGGALTSQIPICEFVIDDDEIPECIVTLDTNNLPTCVGVSDCQFEPDLTLGVPAGTLLIDTVTGNPIPLMINIQLMAPMNRAGARASAKFFTKFSLFDAAVDTIDHRGFLNKSELKLLSEWLDLRGNYYNNPFDSVEPN